METLGQRIKGLRDIQKLSLTDLAVKVGGITRAELEKYEQDRATPNAIVLGKLAEALGVPAGELRQGS